MPKEKIKKHFYPLPKTTKQDSNAFLPKPKQSAPLFSVAVQKHLLGVFRRVILSAQLPHTASVRDVQPAPTCILKFKRTVVYKTLTIFFNQQDLLTHTHRIKNLITEL